MILYYIVLIKFTYKKEKKVPKIIYCRECGTEISNKEGVFLS